MRKLLLFLLLSPLAFGQVGSGNITASGSTCATTNACVIAALSTSSSSASIAITGTWSATVQFEASPDGGTTYVAINGTPPNSTTAVTSTTGNGVWTFNVGSMTHLRARASALASGTVGVNINASSAPIMTSGSGTGGTVTSLTATSPVVITPSPTTGVGVISCPTCGTGTGTVTSVIGTANQITSDGSTTTPTLSIPSTFIAPGTISAVTSIDATKLSGNLPAISGASLTGYPWSSLANPAGNLALSNGTSTSIFSGTAATNQFFAWKNTTAAVVGTSQGSPILAHCGRAFHGSADVEDCMTFGELPGNGNDAAITFTIGHTGTSTGAVTTNFPGAISMNGSTSGVSSLTPSAVAGTSTNPLIASNVIQIPNGSSASPGLQFTGDANTGFFHGGVSHQLGIVEGGNIATLFDGTNVVIANNNTFSFSSTGAATGTPDLALSRIAVNYGAIGTGASGNSAGFLKTAQTLQITGADVTCGTGGTISSCVAMQTITGLSKALPLVAANWSFTCDLIVSQATAAAANQIGVQTATNGATNIAATAIAYTAAGTSTSASITGVASSTTAQSVITFTPGGTGTKLPIHLAGTIEGTSASGTTFNLTVLTGAAADLLTIYRGSSCYLY